MAMRALSRTYALDSPKKTTTEDRAPARIRCARRVTESAARLTFHSVSESHPTVLIVASGPSLRGFDLSRLQGKGFILAVNGAAHHVKADAWVTVDTLGLQQRVRRQINSLADIFGFPRYVAIPDDFGRPDARCPCDRCRPPIECLYLRRVPHFSDNPSELCGLNSALGALNLAKHFQAKRIVLFGVDGRNIGEYFYGRRKRHFAKQDEMLRKLPELFADVKNCEMLKNCEIINASPESAIDCFPRMSPSEALMRL